MTHDNALRMLDRRVVESALGMGSGYVLDFSNRTFAEFFEEHGVDIYDDEYAEDGESKANRLRCFLRLTPPPLSGQVLAALLEHRLASDPDGVDSADLARYQRIVKQFGGEEALATIEASKPQGPAGGLGSLLFESHLFSKTSVDPEVVKVLVARMDEAKRCITVDAHLAATILCGSVLEGLCVGYGQRNRESVSRAFVNRYNRQPPKLQDWRLAEWIDVLTDLGVLSLNVRQFGHGLRDFRNFVHPAEQVKHSFAPDRRTAEMAFRVVTAAAEDLARATTTAVSEQI